MILIIPNSPKYYYEKKEFNKARKTFAFIARFNGKEEFYGKFDIEKINEEMESIFNLKEPL